ncbi:hypothetical protein ACLJJ6_00585 [Pediococcus siamensis]|uniref:hypothetical protein n=1 Tax=Pediococcus siamensis TaxID=381829 RepID=UPI0039A0BE39
MRKFMVRHKCLSSFLIIIFSILVGTGSYLAKVTYDNYQAKQKIVKTLKANGYSNIVPRSSVRKEATGPFSGISWYDYTFATSKTLQISRQYQQLKLHKDTFLTLKNCPIVYRLILTPPTTKVSHWTVELYMDTNQALRDDNQSSYIQHLNQVSHKTLKVSE